MATDGPTPPDCAQDIFECGEHVATLDAASNAAENWVQAVAKLANARLGWHYVGGRACVKFLGDTEARWRVYQALWELAPSLKGHIIRIHLPNLLN